MEHSDNLLTADQFFQLLYAKKKNKKILRWVIENLTLPEYITERLKRYLKKGPNRPLLKLN